MAKYAPFQGVKGYKTYTSAIKRGEEVAAARSDLNYRWVVIVLPNGRFAPMVILNNGVHGGPGRFLGERNLCLAN